MERARASVPEIQYASGTYEALAGADAAVLVTDWNEFKNLDLNRVRMVLHRPVFIDGRNVYDPIKARGAGLIYYASGRGSGEALK
jgi:UDPglucose 6-dehydrogenase